MLVVATRLVEAHLEAVDADDKASCPAAKAFAEGPVQSVGEIILNRDNLSPVCHFLFVCTRSEQVLLVIFDMIG